MADNNTRAILFFASEWDTSKGGLSSFNLELVTQCAQIGNQYNLQIWCAVPKFSPEQKEAAEKSGVVLIQARKYDSKTALSFIFGSGLIFPPACKKERIMAVVGHAHITGEAAKDFVDTWDGETKKPIFVFFNHITPLLTDQQKNPGKSGKEKQEQLLDLAKHADIIFSVGPKMYKHFATEYKPFTKKPVHHQYIPPLSKFFLEKFQPDAVAAEEARVLCFGRAEDEKVKGFDIIARAMGEVAKVDHFTNPILVARGIPEDELEETSIHLQDIANTGKFTLHCYPFGSQHMIAEDLLRSSLAVMPSRSEPFGLVVLEAIAAGVPVLISNRSGVADYLKSLNIGADSLIVDVSGSPKYLEEDAQIWKAKIVNMLNNIKGHLENIGRIREILIKKDEANQSVKKFIEACLTQYQGPQQSLLNVVPVREANAAQPEQVPQQQVEQPVQPAPVPQASFAEQERHLTSRLVFQIGRRVTMDWKAVAERCEWDNPSQLSVHLGAGHEIASLVSLLYKRSGVSGLKAFREALEEFGQPEALQVINGSISRAMFY